MSKPKKSGSAVFMDIVIYACIALAAIFLVLYYAGIAKNSVILWTGVTFFTILYHFWGRIPLGKLTLTFKIKYDHWWFRERRFEMKLYKLLRIRKWKEKVLTYDPAAFSVKDHTLEEIATTMSKAETDHWINEILSLTTLLFALLWGELWIFLLTAIIAMLFDAQFIVVQRYNRPKVLRAIELRKQKEALQAHTSSCGKVMI